MATSGDLTWPPARTYSWPRTVAARHPHLRCVTYDLPAVAPIAARTIASAGLSDRVTVASGDFLNDPLPKADVITMSLILHDWNLEKKQQLIKSAYDALPEGGAFIVIDNLIGDDRRANAFGLPMSLNMLIEFGDASMCHEVAAEQLERNTRSLADVFVEYMERGDEIEVAVGPNRWTGFVVDVGDDVVALDIDRGRVDVVLGSVSFARLSSAPAGAAQVRRTEHCRSFIARMRDLAGANAGATVEIGGGALQTITGQLRAVAESHVEMTTRTRGGF